MYTLPSSNQSFVTAVFLWWVGLSNAISKLDYPTTVPTKIVLNWFNIMDTTENVVYNIESLRKYLYIENWQKSTKLKT